MLPLRGYPWANFDLKTCRHCCSGYETASHVINDCRYNLQQYTDRHNTIQDELVSLLEKLGIATTIIKRLPELSSHGRQRRPDIEFSLASSRLMIDVTVAFDRWDDVSSAYQRKIDRYKTFGTIKPLLVGSLGFWHPKNDEIRSIIAINHRLWVK